MAAALFLGMVEVTVAPARAQIASSTATPTPTSTAVPTPDPRPAPAAGATPSHRPTGMAGTPSSSPSAGASSAEGGEQVPVAGLTPSVSGTGQTRLTLVLFDSDIVLVGGRGFTPDDEVSITAAAADLGGSASALPGVDGRFILGFQVPAGFSGTVTVTATQGAAEASGSLDVVVPAAESTDATTEPAEPATTTAGAGSGLDSAGELSGLPWMSGVYPSHRLADVMGFGEWRGRPNDIAHVFTVRDKGWSGIIEPSWPVDLYRDFPGRLVISQPTFPKGQGSNGACARGEYDEQWKTFGRFLVDHGRADTIVRIGWEFNGLFMYWHSDPAGTEFKECFRRIATAIRSTNPDVKIDWTFNAHNSPVPNGNSPWAAYPGDEYVDYVGIDSYDFYPPSKDQAQWTRQCEDPNGLCYLMNFAREHGKKVSVGEWGVVSCNPGGGGDNPFYIQKMHETFMANTDVMGYDAYFNDGAPGNVCSTIMNGGQNPRSAVEYQRLFGAP